MENSFIDSHCANCATPFSSTSEIFSKINIIDDSHSSKIQEIAILDAILHIYGFSATNLASAYLDVGRCDNLSSIAQVTETTIHQLKKLANETSVLTKAIKTFSPTCIKIELGPEENDQRNLEGEDYESTSSAANAVPLRRSSLDKWEPLSTEPGPRITENLFQTFNFEQDYDDNYKYEEEDAKMDPLAGTGLMNESMYASEDTDTLKCSYGQDPKIIIPLNSQTKKLSEGLNIRCLPRLPPLCRTHLIRQPSCSPSNAKKIQRLTSGDVTGHNGTKLYCGIKLPIEQILVQKREKAIGLNKKTTQETVKKQVLEKRYSWQTKKSLNSGEQPESADCDTSVEYSKSFLGPNLYKQSHEECKKQTSTNWSCISSKERQASDNQAENFFESNDDFPSSASIVIKPNKTVKKKNLILKCSCGSSHGSLHALRRHENKHPTQEPVICDICDESFNKIYLLYGHKSIEHSVLPEITFKCSLCDAKYLNRTSLNTHVEHHHPTTTKSFKCKECDKTFNCLKYLRKHNQTHNDDDVDKELFKCKECGILLKHNNSLKKHIRIMHGTQKTFICHLCGKTTKNMSNMKIHMVIHDPNRILKRKSQNATVKSNKLSPEKEK